MKALRIPSTIIHVLPIPMFARSKAWVCGRSLAGIAGSNSAGGMDVIHPEAVTSFVLGPQAV